MVPPSRRGVRFCRIAGFHSLPGVVEPYDVTVNAVLPGPTMSKGVERMLAGQAEAEGKSVAEVGQAFVHAKRQTSIIGRVASVEEVAT